MDNQQLLNLIGKTDKGKLLNKIKKSFIKNEDRIIKMFKKEFEDEEEQLLAQALITIWKQKEKNKTEKRRRAKRRAKKNKKSRKKNHKNKGDKKLKKYVKQWETYEKRQKRKIEGISEERKDEIINDMIHNPLF